MRNDALYLVQTDTTVGFLSGNSATLAAIKTRSHNKPFLKVYASLKQFKADYKRAPNRYKSLLRHAKKTTFVCKDKASRIVTSKPHHDFVGRFESLYSTSANRSGAPFDLQFALEKSDIIVEDARGFYEFSPSQIVHLGAQKMERLR